MTTRMHAALAFGVSVLLAAMPASAGVITFNSLSTGDPVKFDSSWEWAFTDSTWAAPPLTMVLGKSWKVTLQGFAGETPTSPGNLRDITTHLIVPHNTPSPGDDQPGPTSSFDYNGLSNGTGGRAGTPIQTFFTHPKIGDFDVYKMSALALKDDKGNIVTNLIGFVGEHTQTSEGAKRAPEPPIMLLLAPGLVGVGAVALRVRKFRA